jgi:hypothetical protein
MSEKREKKRRKKKERTGEQGVMLLFPSQAMTEQDWTSSKVM